MVETVVRGKIDKEDETTCQLPVLLPEHILKYLLGIGLNTAPEQVAEYWAHHRNKRVPWALAHPSDGTHIPVGLYGDAACYGDSTEQKVWGIWMNLPLFRPASVRMSRFLLCAVDHVTSFGIRTLFPLLRVVVESLNKVYDHGLLGYRFATTEIRGDWEFQYLVFRMAKFWNTTSFCWRCQATRGLNDPEATSYLDFSDNPGWKQTQHRTHADFTNSVLQSSGPRSVSTRFRSVSILIA